MSNFITELVLKSRRLRQDSRGMAAIEFALLFPVIILLFFGTIEVSDGVAVDRKVGILTRTLSDLISQASSVTSTDISNAYAIGAAVMTPYASGPIQAKITQVYVDSTTGVPRVNWATASNATAHQCGDTLSIPTGLLVKGTYLIMSEVSYAFTPAAGFSGGQFRPPTFNLSDQTFTRPRQSTSVTFSGAPVSCS